MRRRSLLCAGVCAAALCLIGVIGMAGCAASTSSSASSSAASEPQTANTLELVQTDDPFTSFAANSATPILTGMGTGAEGADAKGALDAQNTCYSPLSLYLALALAADGTQSDAQDQLLNVLGAADKQTLLATCNDTIDALTDTYDPYTLKIANSLWAAKGYTFKSSYLTEVQSTFDAEAFDVELGTETTDKAISDWIAANTENLLQPSFSTTPSMVAALINTIYFKDSWLTSFPEESTAPQTFHGVNGDADVPFMHLSLEESAYAEGSNFTAARLVFQGGASMTFYLPNDGITPLDLVGTPESARTLLETELELQNIDWSVPKFTVESSFKDLVQDMELLGVTDIFDPANDGMFAPMIEANNGLDEALYISDIIQETHLALDENGVEAAAYTAMIMKAMAMAPDVSEPIPFVLDRPFVYALTSPEGIPLFMGCIQTL